MLPGSSKCILSHATCNTHWKATRKCLVHCSSAQELDLTLQIAQQKALQTVQSLIQRGQGKYRQVHTTCMYPVSGSCWVPFFSLIFLVLLLMVLTSEQGTPVRARSGMSGLHVMSTKLRCFRFVGHTFVTNV